MGGGSIQGVNFLRREGGVIRGEQKRGLTLGIVDTSAPTTSASTTFAPIGRFDLF